MDPPVGMATGAGKIAGRAPLAVWVARPTKKAAVTSTRKAMASQAMRRALLLDRPTMTGAVSDAAFILGPLFLAGWQGAVG